MRQFNTNKGIKGSGLIREHALRFAYMITKTAKCRACTLTFWHKYGFDATKDAYGVSLSTLYRWQKKLDTAGGKVEALNNGSRAPKRRNKRRADYRIEEFIIGQRRLHPRLGKKKLTPLLKAECVKWDIPAPSEPTVGRIIKDLKERKVIPEYTKLSFHAGTGKLNERKAPRKAKKLRRKGHKADKPGALVEIDTVVIFVNNIRRYIITAIDVHGRFAYAHTYKSPSSSNAKDFFEKLNKVTPFTITHIQTDNGSEFAKHFRKYVEELGIAHFNTYPRCPKMNAHIERFNRTIQEEFVNWNKQTLLVDISAFNEKMVEWLTWYNTVRPHESLGLMPPLWYITSLMVKDSQSG